MVTDVPHMIRIWDYERNTEKPENVSAQDRNPKFWKCPDCKYSWTAAPRFRFTKEARCPCHELNKVVKSGVNDVLTVTRGFLDFLDEDNDFDLIATQGVGSKMSVNFKCKICGRKWKTRIATQIKKDENGNHLVVGCKHKKASVGMTVADVPHMMKMWDFERNTDRPEDLPVRDRKSRFWKCPDCGYMWSAAPNTRYKGTGNCPRHKSNKAPEEQNSPSFSFVRESIADVPHMIRMWDYERNTESPKNISARDLIPRFWECPDCKYSWQASPKSRSETTGKCPCHELQRVTVSGINDVITIVKGFSEYLDENNDFAAIALQGTNSCMEVNYKCRECGRKWRATIVSQVKRIGFGEYYAVGCRHRNVNDISKSHYRSISYSTKYPDLKQMYQESLNGIPLDDIHGNSARRKSYYWTCLQCKNFFKSPLETMIQSYQSNTKGCPICARKNRYLAGNFAALHPELIDEYSPNNLDDLNEVLATSTKSVDWSCKKCGTRWMASFALRNSGGGNCPLCNRGTLIKNINSFAAVYPDLIEYWSNSNSRSSEEVFYNSSEWFSFVCPMCGGEYGSFITDFISDEKHHCPYCKGDKVLPGYNSLKDLFPEAAQRWSNSNELTPDNVLPTLAAQALWICDTCHGEYSAPIKDVVAGTDECPYCKGTRVLPGYNSLKAMYPEVAKRWSSSNESDTDSVLPTFAMDARWICDTCHGVYSAPIRDVVAGVDECPYCKGTKLLPGYNSFADRHPDLISELDELANYLLPVSPNEVLDNSTYKFWWICKNDKSHKYRMSPKNRLMFEKRGREPCLYCRGQRRKLNHFVTNIPDEKDRS